jgi:hypothetical protein
MNRYAPASAIAAALALLLAFSVPMAATGAAPRSGGLSIAIILPVNGSTVKGDVTIAGIASGPDGVPLTVQLSINGGPWYAADGDQGWSWLWSTYAFADGLLNVTARVQGGGGEATAFGTYVVRNTKPSFVLRDIFPPGDNIHFRAGGTASFSVTVDTSYIGSVLVNWTVDGEPVQSGGASWYNYTARATEQGNHTLLVEVIADGSTQASHSWNLTVRPLALPPVVAGFGPADQNFTVFRDDTVRFNLTASDSQGKGLTYHWYYDLEPAPGNVTAPSISLSFNSTGAHVVEVLVSNGETNRTVRWNITVDEPPTLGLLDLLPCTLYIVTGLFLGIWYGRRESVRRAADSGQGTR